MSIWNTLRATLNLDAAPHKCYAALTACAKGMHSVASNNWVVIYKLSHQTKKSLSGLSFGESTWTRTRDLSLIRTAL